MNTEDMVERNTKVLMVGTKLNVEKNEFYYWNENAYDISGEKTVLVSNRTSSK